LITQRKRLVFLFGILSLLNNGLFRRTTHFFSEFLLSCLQNEKELVRNLLPKFRIYLVEVHCFSCEWNKYTALVKLPPVQSSSGAHPASRTMSTGSFPGVKSGRGVTLTPHPLLVTWSRKSRTIPVLPLRAVRPVQSLSACTRVHFTFLPLVKQ